MPIRSLLLAACFAASCAAATAPLPTTALMHNTQPNIGAIAGGSSLQANQPSLAILFTSWCEHCHDALKDIMQLRTEMPNVNIIGLSHRPFEEFDAQGTPTALNAFVAANAPGLPMVTLSNAAYHQLFDPTKIPTIYLFDRSGALTVTYDPSQRPTPRLDELKQQLWKMK
jgi:thiol-disulfide isomerase/thioredoxin